LTHVRICPPISPPYCVCVCVRVLAAVVQVVGADKCSPLADDLKEYVALDHLDLDKANSIFLRLTALDKRVPAGCALGW
jgi:hypothetical protein